MPQYELNYLCGRGVREIVDVADTDEAEVLARRRLLFSEPGFAIAILCEGVELCRITQKPRRPASRLQPADAPDGQPARHRLSKLSPNTELRDHYR